MVTAVSKSMSVRSKLSLEWHFKKTLMNPTETDQFVIDLMADLYYIRQASGRLTVAKQRASNALNRNKVN
jgi:hypothetical protein